jgi:hypothetical protein
MLVKVIVALSEDARLLALEFTVNVTFVAVVDAMPEVEDGVSQFGYPEIEYLMLPDDALSWYWKDEGVKGPP